MRKIMIMIVMKNVVVINVTGNHLGMNDYTKIENNDHKHS